MSRDLVRILGDHERELKRLKAALARITLTAIWTTPVGTISMYGAGSAPTGWLLCQGQAVSRATYSNLFVVLGTTFGSGDGSTTFNLPDLRQRFPLGKAASGTGSTLGSTGGSINHTHTGPSHTHTNPSTSSDSHTHTNPSTSTDTHSHGTSGLVAEITLFDHHLSIQRVSSSSWTRNNAMDFVSGTIQDSQSQSTGADVQGNTDSDGHSHTQGVTGSDGHSHTQGSTGSAGTGATGSENPPYLVVNFIVYTGVE